jgi:hypothetical protein
VSLTLVVFPLVGILQFSLQELLVAELRSLIDCLSYCRPDARRHSLAGHFDRRSIPIICSVLPRFRSDQALLDRVSLLLSFNISWVFVVGEAFDDLLLTLEVVLKFRNFCSIKTRSCSTSMFFAEIISEGFIGRTIINARGICKNI